MKKRYSFLLFFYLLPLLTFAGSKPIGEQIDDWVGKLTGWFVNLIFYQIPINDELSLYWVLIPLLLGALFFTIYFGVPGIQHIGKAIQTVRGKYEKVEELDADLNVADGDNPDTIRIEGKAFGQVTHFQALTAALSATVGLGNIAGVAVAVVVGGPGAIFWMILAGFLGMSSKFVECTLGVKYREIDANGKTFGGPMYYLSKGLKEMKAGGFGKVLAVLFAIMCIGGSFGGGNMFQSNQAASIFTKQLGIEKVEQAKIEVVDVQRNTIQFNDAQVIAQIESFTGKPKGALSSWVKDTTYTYVSDAEVQFKVVSGAFIPGQELQFMEEGKQRPTILANADSLIFSGDLQEGLQAGETGVLYFASNTEMEAGMQIASKREGMAKVIFGIILALFVAVVIIGGIQRIATVTEKIVPFMAVVYVAGAIFILLVNASLIDDAIREVAVRAFQPIAIAGGFLGVLIQGFRRAAFSNEAGIGSAAIAHSAVKTRFPASEGLVALLEPFIDTVVVCTMTGLVIVTSMLKGRIQLGDPDGKAILTKTGETLEGVDLTTFVFQSSIPYFEYILVVAVVLFAFSSMISWSYYGLQSWTYLFGRTKTQETIYKALFCFFVFIGAVASLKNVLNFSDAMIFAMMVPNMIGLLLLFPVVRKELKLYLEHIKRVTGKQ